MVLGYSGLIWLFLTNLIRLILMIISYIRILNQCSITKSSFANMRVTVKVLLVFASVIFAIVHDVSGNKESNSKCLFSAFDIGNCGDRNESMAVAESVIDSEVDLMPAADHKPHHYHRGGHEHHKHAHHKHRGHHVCSENYVLYC